MFNFKKRQSNIKSNQQPNKRVLKSNKKVIYLAGGCFWGVEGYFKKLPGVYETEVGYANGKTDNTDYSKISATDHAETVKVCYDKSRISLEEILLHYFRIIDPLSVNKQGNDIGRQYRTGVYYEDDFYPAHSLNSASDIASANDPSSASDTASANDSSSASDSDSDLKIIDKIFAYEEELHGPIAVEKSALKNFIKAEDYHQDYLDKNPGGYCHIDISLSSKPLFSEKYTMPSDDELIDMLDNTAYNVMRKSDTEAPGSSPLNEEFRHGIYVDKITGEPLFCSTDKFNAGCGWPSFSKPITTDKLTEHVDTSHMMVRTEVVSKNSNSHLGHVFDDGPIEKGGLRYCINGAALRFVPYEKMDEEGYSDYKIFCCE
ncbi:MAG: peptide-methionine (R)-S-oxide reductase MsrB [Christensenellales bacterium]